MGRDAALFTHLVFRLHATISNACSPLAIAHFTPVFLEPPVQRLNLRRENAHECTICGEEEMGY